MRATRASHGCQLSPLLFLEPATAAQCGLLPTPQQRAPTLSLSSSSISVRTPACVLQPSADWCFYRNQTETVTENVGPGVHVLKSCVACQLLPVAEGMDVHRLRLLTGLARLSPLSRVSSHFSGSARSGLRGSQGTPASVRARARWGVGPSFAPRPA